MSSHELRTIQAPLERRYRDDPGSAVITLAAEGELDAGVTLFGADRCRPRRGGAAPGDGRRRGRPRRPWHAGVAGDAPVGFRAIRLTFCLDSDADPRLLAKVLELTERYCVVQQTLARGTAVTVDLRGDERGSDG